MSNNRKPKKQDPNLPLIEQHRTTVFSKPTPTERSKSLTGAASSKLPNINEKRSSVFTLPSPPITEKPEVGQTFRRRINSSNTTIPSNLPPLTLRRGSSKQDDQSEVTLTDAEKKLCMENGVFPEDALQFKRTAIHFQSNIEVRGGSLVLEDKGEEEFSPKPIDIKAKNKKTPGFTRYLLSVRENGKLDMDAEIFTNIYHIPLGKILSAKNSNGENEYEFLPPPQSDFKTGRLVFKSTDPEADPNILYSIQLSHPKKIKKESVWAEGVTRPDWWTDSLNKEFPFYGEAAEGREGAIKHRYPAQYLDLNDPQKQFKLDLVYALRDRKGKILNIAGDNDLYAISISAADLEAVAAGKLKGYLIHERINTLEDTRSFHEMLKRRIELEEYRKGRELTAGEKMDFARNLVQHEKISKLGNSTARESEIVSYGNRGVAADFKHKAIQHAVETGNKFYPQPVKKTLIFTAEGGVRFAKDERALVDFRLEVIKKHFYHISEVCNMRLWGDYVAAQLLLKQPVSKRAITVFMEDVRARLNEGLPLSDRLMQAYTELIKDPYNFAPPKPPQISAGDLMRSRQQYEERHKVLNAPNPSVLNSKGAADVEEKPQSSVPAGRKIRGV